MKIWAADCSFPGGRAVNEDTVRFAKLGGSFLALTADGLGGHGGGREASRLAAQSFLEGFEKRPELTEENLFRLVEEANEKILRQQTKEKKMRTTFAALLCDGSRLASVHVGDSRLYWFRDGSLQFRTLDHSVSQMAVLSGEITEREIRFHGDRNRVLRALGGSELVRPDIFIVEYPDAYSGGGGFPDEAGGADRSAFLLCTDGFWEMVWEEEMLADLLKSEKPEDWLSHMLSRIGGRMHEKSDNLSAVAVFIHTGSKE